MRWSTAAVVVLLAIFAGELLLSVRQQTQTFDESAHIFAGYTYWKHADFGVNPEHPPLVKLVAALPLLPLGLPVQFVPNGGVRGVAGTGGLQFLYSHNADALLFRARAVASLFALAIALLVFFATREMFGREAAILALLILVLEPVVLANGALVTTDIGASAGMFAAVYFFYRYIRRPTVLRLAICGIVTGLALATKHSVLVVLPILVALAVVEVLFEPTRLKTHEDQSAAAKTRRASVPALAGALTAIAVIAFGVLWLFYGFRYAARPNNAPMAPPTEVFLRNLDQAALKAHGAAPGTTHSSQARLIGALERRHLLPESYLYGLTDVATLTTRGRVAFVLGKSYPSGRWFYFPAAFVIKTSLALMALLVLFIWALISGEDLRRPELRRAVLFMAIPPILYFAVAMSSKMQIGVRHILPVYPFLIVLAGAAAWSLARRSRRWAYAVAIILLFDAFSSLRTFPNYLPYSNELWGGVDNTHKVLSDSNVGWGSGLKAVERYLADRHITHCWFAYDATVDPAYYHIPCAPLPTFFSSLTRPAQQQAVPEDIQGPVILSSEAMVGGLAAPGPLNPYQQFLSLKPDAILQGEMMVFNGSFHVPKIAAQSHYILANNLARSGHLDQAILEAKNAATLDPDFRNAHELLASLYFKNKQTDEARTEYNAAIQLYRTLAPEFQAIYGVPKNPFPAEPPADARAGTT
jgi:4-amino-4-deoxy-L-arabinose transferase-like glycosyltransferase